jgi:hypothetical protein
MLPDVSVRIPPSKHSIVRQRGDPFARCIRVGPLLIYKLGEAGYGWPVSRGAVRAVGKVSNRSRPDEVFLLPDLKKTVRTNSPADEKVWNCYPGAR